MKSSSRYRWFVVAVFFAFMLLHQAYKLLIGPLTTPIMETFDINEAQMGAVSAGALIVGAVLYPLWGYLYDRYARAKLLRPPRSSGEPIFTERMIHQRPSARTQVPQTPDSSFASAPHWHTHRLPEQRAE
jgi:hypothetical protein